MQTRSLTENKDAALSLSVDVLLSGGVVLIPTDTLYALCGDALSDEAVEKVRAIKGRDERKPMHALVENLEMAGKYGVITDAVERLARELPLGKITFVVRKHALFESGIFRGVETFGFRIPDNEFCAALLHAFGRPITATSANKAGEEPQRSIATILEQLGDYADGIALAVNGGELPPSAPSTVVDCSGSRPLILREGAVPAADIWNTLRTEE